MWLGKCHLQPTLHPTGASVLAEGSVTTHLPGALSNPAPGGGWPLRLPGPLLRLWRPWQKLNCVLSDPLQTWQGRNSQALVTRQSGASCGSGEMLSISLFPFSPWTSVLSPQSFAVKPVEKPAFLLHSFRNYLLSSHDVPDFSWFHSFAQQRFPRTFGHQLQQAPLISALE